MRLAQHLLGQGLKVEPLNTRLLFASAVLCSSLGRHGDALELLDRGLSNPTGSGNYRVRTGTALAPLCVLLTDLLNFSVVSASTGFQSVLQ